MAKMYKFTSPIRVTWRNEDRDSQREFLSKFLHRVKPTPWQMRNAVLSAVADFNDSDLGASLHDAVDDVRMALTKAGKCVVTVTSRRELAEPELEAVEANLIGQFSDGWGEAMEQQDMGHGHYVSFWSNLKSWRLERA